MKLMRLTTVLLILTVFVNAQTIPANQKTQKNESGSELQQRRATALSILQSLAIEARSYSDEPLRARVQAHVADLLWSHDKEAARSLFRRAWEIAEALDQAGATSNLPGRRPTSGGRSPARTNLRRAILQLASRRDYALGEEFLAKLTSRDEAASKSNVLSSAETAERLRLAMELVDNQNIERALQFADPAVTRINIQTIEFLVALREKDALAADRRFASLLKTAFADPASDANTVSLLTSYTFTPSIYLVVTRSGIPSSTGYAPRPVPTLNQQLRRAYFDTAAAILIRPLTQIDQSSAGRAGTHFMVMRLLPLFQQHSPDFIGPLNAQLAALGPEAAQTTANTGEVALKRGMGDDTTSKNAELNERLDRAKNSDERDRAYAFAAIGAAEQMDPGARDLVDKIEDAETRKGVRTWVDYMMIRSTINQKRPDEALLLIRKTQLPWVLRTHFLTKVAGLKVKPDPAEARELLEEALADARRLDPDTSDRAFSLIALLRQFSLLDRTRTWELLSETIKTINSVPDFTAERGHASLRLEGKFSISFGVELATSEDLTEVFRQLAEQSFYQALDVSKSFRADAPRALATIAVVRTVLVEQP